MPFEDKRGKLRYLISYTFLLFVFRQSFQFPSHLEGSEIFQLKRKFPLEQKKSEKVFELRHEKREERNRKQIRGTFNPRATRS